MDQLLQGGSYPGLVAFIVDLFGVHDIQQDLEGDDNVGVDDGAGLMALIFGEALGMDDSHLLDDG